MGKENSTGVCSPFNDDNVERHFVLYAEGEEKECGGDEE